MKKIVKTLLLALFGAWLFTFLALRFESHEYVQLSDVQLAKASAYLQDNITPTPAGWQWRTYTPEAGVELRTGSIEATNAKGTVIVVPGFTATIEMTMREIVKINAAGYKVASIEYRGQGASYRPLSNPEKGHVDSYEKLGEELAKFSEQARIPGKPLFFYSISKGAHITMRMAGEQMPDASAYALIVPMIQVNTGNANYAAMRTAAGALHNLGLGTLYGPGQSSWPGDELVFGKAIPCNSNPDTAQTREALFALTETVRTNGVTVSWLHRTAASTDAITSPGHMANISQPLKMFTAGIDTLVNTDAAQKFCNNLAQCELTHFAQARHCITREDFDLYDGIVASSITLFDNNL